MKALCPVIAIVVCIAGAANFYAHGPIHDQIAALTERIVVQPASAELYVQRGELHRAHRDWPAALVDYDRAAGLDPRLAVVDLCRGLLYFDAGRPRAAIAPLDRFLTRHPTHARGRVARARVRVRLGERAGAAEDFSMAIALTSDPPPEYYLERATALAEDGQLSRAIRGLEEGLNALGNVITLQELALEMEVGAGLFDDALARLERATSGMTRREAWLVRRGDILARAGRRAEARDAYARSLAAIDALRPEQRHVRAVTELETRALVGLAALTMATTVSK